MNNKSQDLAEIQRTRDRKLRLLFTIGSLAEGGAERWVLNLITKLDRDEFECAVVVVKPLLSPCDSLLNAFKGIQVPVYTLDLKHYQLLFPLGTMRMKKVFRKFKPDLVQTNLLVDRFYAVRAAASLNVPLVSTFHGETQLANLSKFKRRIYLEHLEFSDAIVAVSNHARRSLPEDFRESVIVIEPFVDVKHFAPTRQRSFSGKQELTLGTVSTLTPKKNIPQLVHLFAEVTGRLPFVKKLIIIGEGPERPAIEDAISCLGLSGAVDLVGYQEDIGPWHSRMDFYVSTSLGEGLPQAMLEAMSSSVIPIVNNVGGVPEALSEGRNGFLLDPANHEANVQKLEQIFVDCVRDPSKYTAMAKAARRTVIEKFSSEIIVPRYRKLFIEIAQEREGSE